MQSIWNYFSNEYAFPELEQDLNVDVAVIGGGITGISAAHMLAQQGAEVAVLESRKIGGGTTAHSTGNLYCMIDQILSSLKEKYDYDVIEKVVASRREALGQIEMWIKEFDLDCDYRKTLWYLYSLDGQNVKKIEKEFETGRKANVPLEYVDESEMPVAAEKALKLDGQAQFNPKSYVQELANNVQSERYAVYEQAHVTKVEKEGGGFKVHTEKGQTVTAEYVIHATHTPKGIKIAQTMMGPYREYGTAAKVSEQVHPDGAFWGYFDGGKKISTRNYSKNGQQFVMAVGEAHKVSEAGNNEPKIDKLEMFLHEHFDVEKIAFRWGGQHYRPADLLPYIGSTFRHENEFIATGFSTDGLVYGTLAAMILADRIIGKENRWEELYKSTRMQPKKSAKQFFKENKDVAKKLVHTIAGDEDEFESVMDLQKGEGKVVEEDGHKLAVYRHDDGGLEVRSAVCPHLKCTVSWNEAEKTWDCPCHGSRFKTDGSVIEGPAFKGLRKIEFDQ